MPYTLSQLNQSGIPQLVNEKMKVEKWTERRSHILRTWLDYIGELPVRRSVIMNIRSEIKEPGHTRLYIQYDAAYGDTITAYLLIPDGPRPSAGFPAVIALHPTNEQGKDSIATAMGVKNRTYAFELVRRGYIVLAPDALTSGERIYPNKPAFHSGPFYEKHPEWSTVAKNASDHMHGVDVLCSLPEVDAGAIGTIGHSFGGYNSYFLAGLDDRIKAIVSSCGFSPFTGDPQPEHWGYRSFPYTHIPKVSADLERDKVPFEFHEIAALCAPTPFFNYSGQDDHIFPHWKSVGEGMLELARLYRWLDQEERFQSYLGSGGHDFPVEIRQLAYQFLDRWLKEKQA